MNWGCLVKQKSKQGGVATISIPLFESSNRYSIPSHCSSPPNRRRGQSSCHPFGIRARHSHVRTEGGLVRVPQLGEVAYSGTRDFSPLVCMRVCMRVSACVCVKGKPEHTMARYKPGACFSTLRSATHTSFRTCQKAKEALIRFYAHYIGSSKTPLF